MAIGSWLLGIGLNKAGEKAIKTIFSESLEKRLRRTLEKWQAALPENATLLSIDSLFVLRPAETVEAPPPQDVFEQLAGSRIPSPNDWLKLLLWQWERVRASVSEPAPFFCIEKDAARKHLENLATALTTECTKDPNLFQPHIHARLEEVVRSVQERLPEPSASDVRHGGSAQHAAQTRLGPVALDSRAGYAQQEEDPRRIAYHAKIDEAVEYSKRGEPAVAIALLEKLKRESWDALDQRLRYRLLANLGHAHEKKEQKGDLERAARYYLECKTYQPEDERAQSLEAAAYHMLDDSRRAHEIATSVRERHPTSELAHAAWIRSAPEGLPLSEIEQSVPAHLRNSVEVAAALTWRALSAMEFDKAERYARQALEQEPDSAPLLEAVGAVLLEKSRADAFARGTPNPCFGDRPSLKEAVTLFEGALKSLPVGLASCARVRLHHYLGLTFGLMGDGSKAHEYLRQAHAEDPEDGGIARQYALTLYDRGDYDAAIDVLRPLQRRDTSGSVPFLLARLLAVRNGPGDRAEAISCLDGQLANLKEMDAPLRLHVLECLVNLYGTVGDHAKAEETLRGVDQGALPDAVLSAMWAAVKRRSGDAIAARKWARRARSHLTADATRAERHLVAAELTLQKRYRDALPIWKRVVKPYYFEDDTRSLLHCAQRCGDDLFIMDFCKALRENGVIHRDSVALELDTLAKYHCVPTTVELMQRILGTTTEERLAQEIRLRLSCLGIVLAKDAWVETSCERLPRAEEAHPRTGLIVVQVLSHGPEPMLGIRYAYTLLRLHFGSPWAHKAMVMAFLSLRGRDPGISRPEQVGPGSAVCIVEKDSPEQRWYVIEDDPNPDASRNELRPDHPLAARMAGRRVADEFALAERPVGPRVFQIVQILDKYVFRFNRCMEEWEQRFPETFFVCRFVAKHDEKGDPDLTPMLRSVDQRVAETTRRDEVYKSNLCISSTTYALFTRVTVLEAVEHLASQGLPVRCCDGSPESIVKANLLLDSRRALVLDASTLATLYLTGGYRFLRSLPFRFAVTYGTLLEFRKRQLEQSTSPREGGFLTKRGDQYLFLEEPEEHARRRVEEFSAFLGEVESIATLEEGLALARMERKKRKTLLRIIGRPAAESVALAHEQGHVLWTDDSVVAHFAANDFGCDRVWTEAVFQRALETGSIPIETRNEVLTALVGKGYFYTRVWPEMVIEAAERAGSDLDESSLNALLRWFSNPATVRQGIRDMALAVVRHLVDTPSFGLRGDPLAFRLLDQIDRRKDGRAIIGEMYRLAGRFCGLHVVAAQKIQQLLQVWARAPGRNLYLP